VSFYYLFSGVAGALRDASVRSSRTLLRDRWEGLLVPHGQVRTGPVMSRPPNERSLRSAGEERASASRRASATGLLKQSAALRDTVRSFLAAGSSGTGRRCCSFSRPAPQGPVGGAARPSPTGANSQLGQGLIPAWGSQVRALTE